MYKLRSNHRKVQIAAQMNYDGLLSVESHIDGTTLQISSSLETVRQIELQFYIRISTQINIELEDDKKVFPVQFACNKYSMNLLGLFVRKITSFK